MVAKKKKDFYQEGENLVNRRLLPFMLHLAAHLLAYHAVAFMLLLSRFSFAPAHVSMDYILIKTWGQHPIVLWSLFCNSHQLFQLRLPTVAHVPFQVHSNVCVCLLLPTYFSYPDSNVPPITCKLETHNAKNLWIS